MTPVVYPDMTLEARRFISKLDVILGYSPRSIVNPVVATQEDLTFQLCEILTRLEIL